MALNLSLLTTKAECDIVLDDVAAELDTYQQRDSTGNYQDRQATRAQSAVTALLAGVNAEITAYTNILATPGLTNQLRRLNQSKLRRANDRLENLTERTTARTGPAAFLGELDDEQVDAQVAVLTRAQSEVTDYKATLPA
jgi:hypothetical protein